MKHNPLYLHDILSVDDLTPSHITVIFQTAKKLRTKIKKSGRTNILSGKLMTALFYEPSSRTIGSFVAAMQRLGGGFIPLQGVSNSSVAKGETLADTVRTFGSYTDIIVIRHPDVGSAKIAAEFCDKPVINAGDGIGEHPTQALLDLFTIRSHFGDTKKLTVTMVGDLLNGRTVHSLSKLLSLMGNVSINLVSPAILKIPNEILSLLKNRSINVHESDSLSEVLPTTDVLYVTRVQKERFKNLAEYEKLKHAYIITPTTLKSFKKTGIVMHPLPRVGEITMDVDLDPRAVYITEQMHNGMLVRMALLTLILTKHGI